MQQFEIVSETSVHSRYLSVFDRKVKFCASESPNEVSDAVFLLVSPTTVDTEKQWLLFFCCLYGFIISHMLPCASLLSQAVVPVLVTLGVL